MHRKKCAHLGRFVQKALGGGASWGPLGGKTTLREKRDTIAQARARPGGVPDAGDPYGYVPPALCVDFGNTPKDGECYRFLCLAVGQPMPGKKALQSDAPASKLVVANDINAALLVDGVNCQLVNVKTRGMRVFTLYDLLQQRRGAFALLVVIDAPGGVPRRHWASYDAARGLLLDRPTDLTFIEAEDRTLEGALKLRGQLSWRHVERVYVLRKRWV